MSRRGKAVYKETGFGGDFYLHHQGGALGYAARYYCAAETDQNVIMNNQAFSWNPIIAGVKSMVEELKVRTYDASRQMAINLSGGNQQKVVFSKWVTRRLGVGRMDSGGFSLFLKGGGKLKNILDNSVFAVSNTRILGIPLVAYIFIGATRRYGAL